MTEEAKTSEPQAAPALSVVGPDDGETIVLGTTHMRVLEDGSHTGHRLAIAESVLAPHAQGPPQHRHGRHDEGFYILSGTVRFTVPSAPSGVDVDGVELTFVDGEVTKARADRGDEYLQAALATDDGARRLGEIGIGTNFGIDRPTGTILFDEKIGGTVHLALGRSYPETKGRNESALHWDLICDLRAGGTLSADGELVQANGRFVV